MRELEFVRRTARNVWLSLRPRRKKPQMTWLPRWPSGKKTETLLMRLQTMGMRKNQILAK